MLLGWGGSVYFLYKLLFILMIVIELFIVVNKKILWILVWFCILGFLLFVVMYEFVVNNVENLFVVFVIILLTK